MVEMVEMLEMVEMVEMMVPGFMILFISGSGSSCSCLPCCFVDFLFCLFSLLFAAFWSWKLPFQRFSQQFGVPTSHFPLYLHIFATFYGARARTVYVVIFLHLGPRVHLGWFRFFWLSRVSLLFFRAGFSCFLGLVLGVVGFSFFFKGWLRFY